MTDDDPEIRLTECDTSDWPARSNVSISPNVFRRTDGMSPTDDVAFRVRVRGRYAIRQITPPGMHDPVTNTLFVTAFSKADEQKARNGAIDGESFQLLDEQLRMFKAITCIYCGRTVQGFRKFNGIHCIGFVDCMCPHGRGVTDE